MRVNVDSVNQLINTKFRGNQTFFAETIQIDRCYLNQILNKKANAASSKVCNAIIKFCENNNLNYKDFIFLE